jgi:serine protease Do
MRHNVLISMVIFPLLLGAVQVNALGDSQDTISPRVYVAPGNGDESGMSYLGVDTRDVTKDRMAALKLNKEAGVEVTMVDQDAPAGKAGLKEGDVILSLNGQAVESVEQLKRMIHEIPPGRDVTLGISRDGQPITLKATLADRRKAMHMGPGDVHVQIPPIPPIPPMPPMPEMDFPSIIVHYPSRAGLMVENLTPQLADFFGVKGGGQGVLVRSVQKGSFAEAAGFKAGDVIVRVGSTRINDTSDWRMAMRDHRSGPVTIAVIRDKREQTLSLKMPERKQSRNGTGADIEANLDFSELQNEFNQIQPELEQARAEMQSATQEATREIAKHQAEWRHQAEKACAQARKEMERQQKILQEELKKMQRQMRVDMDEL